jgi:hypothetical protein
MLQKKKIISRLDVKIWKKYLRISRKFIKI